MFPAKREYLEDEQNKTFRPVYIKKLKGHAKERRVPYLLD